MARPTYPLAGDEITASWGTDVAKAANGVQAGSVNVTLTAAQIGTADVVFPFPYSAPPTVVATQAANSGGYVIAVGVITTTGFRVSIQTRGGNSTTATILATWVAVGVLP